MRTEQCYAFVALLGVLALGSPTASDAQWAPYDNFNALSINPEKWEESFASGGPSNPTTEVVNRLQGGKLRLGVTQYGLTNTSVGTSGGEARLGAVADPGSIIGMQAQVTVHQAEVDACAGNTSTTIRARAQIVGGFFNDGSTTSGSDRTGDIIAGIQKMRDTIQGDVIRAFVVRCPNPSCSFTVSVAGQNFVPTWGLEELHTISVLWDKPNNRFIYSVAGASAPEEIILPYAQDDSTLPVNNFKQLSISNSAANCDDTPKRSSMEAFFDTVMVQRRL